MNQTQNMKKKKSLAQSQKKIKRKDGNENIYKQKMVSTPRVS
jgi:hypothetical protein